MASTHHQNDLESFLQCLDQWPIYTGYEEFNKNRKEIRVLKIWFPSGTQDLHGCLKHVDLDSCPHFEALSYYWGPPDLQRPIMIDGEAVMISKNLHTFLVTLCSLEQELPVWADSMCINQADIQERNHQVTMMGDIYRKAVRVQAWIGDADADSNFALDCVKYLATGVLSNVDHPPRLKTHALQAFRVVAARPYWERMWVIQEVALASELLIVSGVRRVRWDDFIMAVDRVLDVKPQLNKILTGSYNNKHHSCSESEDHEICMGMDPDLSPPQQYSHERNVILIKRLDILRSAGQDLSLIQLAANFADHLCTDPRDKIYALLGIVNQSYGSSPSVDYNKSVLEVYFDVLQAALSVILPSYNKPYGIQMSLFELTKAALAILKGLPISQSDFESEFFQGSVRVPFHDLKYALDVDQSRLVPCYLDNVEPFFLSKDVNTSMRAGDLEFRLSSARSIIVRVDPFSRQYEVIGLVDRSDRWFYQRDPLACFPPSYECFGTELCEIPDRTMDGSIGTIYAHVNRATLLLQIVRYSQEPTRKTFQATERSLISNFRLLPRPCTCRISGPGATAATSHHEPILSWLNERIHETPAPLFDSWKRSNSVLHFTGLVSTCDLGSNGINSITSAQH